MLGVLLAAVLAVLGNLTIQTYLAVFPRESAAVNAATLGAGRAFAAASAAFAVAMAGLAACWWLRPVPPAAVVPALLLWSAAAWAVPPPVQTRVLALAGPDDGPQVMALTSSAVYVGASLGGAAGGRLLASGGPGTLPPAAGACALAALAAFAAFGHATPSARAGKSRADGFEHDDGRRVRRENLA
ncbi:hypothetical protein ACFQU9_00225 [Actinomadura namibiensis]|uniref:Putative MFS family arabinose efflux permease n=1 Tax=Actinomadura namibiensis TaxID=182080 RepID=A0A7W3QLF2_ACTNM|nr:hypothetical protein [Actinomadura namibiensis]MBA8951371.1 putative MFS family arabinose efflux permease [Actinomadura namibiensis]